MLKGLLAETDEKFVRGALDELEKKSLQKRVQGLSSDLQIGSEGSLAAYYAPFKFKIGPQTKVVIVGITPGKDQALAAFKAKLDGENIRSKASFNGNRSGLIQMLDEIGLHSKLKIQSSSELFDPSCKLAAMTSLAIHPILKNGDNYTGYSPALHKSKLAYRMIEIFFRPEIEKVKKPLIIIPMGDAVTKTLLLLPYLNKSNLLILKWFPHYSGANGWRVRKFNQHKEDFIKQIRKFNI